jgi:hypothetical protein
MRPATNGESMQEPEAGTAADGEPATDGCGRTGASPTRRGLLGAAATLGAAALAGCASVTDDDPASYARTVGPTPAATPGSTGTGTRTGTATESRTEAGAEAAPDVAALNDALRLERLTSALYRGALAEFGDGEFVRADVLSRFDERVRRAVPGYLRTAGAHEATHVEALSATITDLGGEPVAAADYEFGYGTPSEFLRVARRLEGAVAAASAGVATAVVDGDALATVLGVHGVEARHAGLLNLLLDESPFPRPVDDPASTAGTLAAVGDVVVGEVDASTLERGTAATPARARTRADGRSDVDVLNDALRLEHLTSALYREGLERFDATDVATAEALRGFSFPFRATVHDRLSAVGAHEAAHVEAVAATVSDLGGTPVEGADYEFGYGTPSEFLGVARRLEGAAVGAFARAAASLESDDAVATAVGVHGVEARHAGFLDLLEGAPPFPDDPDGPGGRRSTADVRELVDGFVVDRG